MFELVGLFTGAAQGFNSVFESFLAFLIIVIIGALIIIVVGALIFLLPAAVIAFVVWFLTRNTTWAAVAFLLVAVISLFRNRLKFTTNNIH